MHTPSSLGRSRFTLVEMLVVVSIIAVLASILLPALSKAREKARTMTCANNLKQIAMAWSLYLEDEGGIMPGPHLLDSTGNYSRWHHIPAFYSGAISANTEAAYNAELQNPQAFKWMRCETDTERGIKYSNYGFNGYHYAQDASLKLGLDKRRQEDVKDTSVTMMFGDSSSNAVGSSTTSFRFANMSLDNATIYSARHAGNMANYVLVDGHLETHDLSWIIAERNRDAAALSQFWDTQGHF